MSDDEAFPITAIERDAILASVAPGEVGRDAFKRFATAESAAGHRMTTLLPGMYRHQTLLGNDGPSLESFASTYRRAAAENTFIVRAAFGLLTMLNERASPPIVLKGAAMVSQRYLGDLGARYLSDVDILIAPETSEHAIAWCAANGWEVADDAWHRHADHALNLISGRWGSVDLHAHLLSGDRNPNLDDQLRNGAIATQVLGQDILVPDPTQLLLHAICHSSRADLRFVVDGLQLIRHHQIDWPLFVEHVTARRHLAVAARAMGVIAVIDPDAVPQHVVLAMRSAERHRVDVVRDPVVPPTGPLASWGRYRASVGRKARHLGPLGTIRTGVILATRRLRSDWSHDRDGRTDDG